MRLLFRLFILLILLTPIAVAALVYYGLGSEPLVAEQPTLSHQDIARARQILKDNDPRKQRTGVENTVHLSEKDLNLAGNYLINSYIRGGIHITLKPYRVTIDASARLPVKKIGPYLNIHAVLQETGTVPEVKALSVGRVTVPGWLADIVARHLVSSVYQVDIYQLANQIIKDISVGDNQVAITYAWEPDTIRQVKQSLLSDADRMRLLSYQQKLVDISRRPDMDRRVSLSVFLQPMFQHALERSREGDPVAENRAAIIVLGAYVSGNSIAAMIPDVAIESPTNHQLTLDGRKDFAKHFMISAALAAASDNAIANAVGLYKEIEDAAGSSGFSFTDLAADQAGTRFGELATSSSAVAKVFQRTLSKNADESIYIPSVKDLPENLSASEFKRRYDRIGSPEYKQIQEEINKRIAACPLYRK